MIGSPRAAARYPAAIASSSAFRSARSAASYSASLSLASVSLISSGASCMEQTIGPLRPALHFAWTTPDEVRTGLAKVHRAVKARTNWLADHGVQRWDEGCGLTHLTVYVEECPD